MLIGHERRERTRGHEQQHRHHHEQHEVAQPRIAHDNRDAFPQIFEHRRGCGCAGGLWRHPSDTKAQARESGACGIKHHNTAKSDQVVQQDAERWSRDGRQ